jgi:hypothetical protein
MRPSGGGVDEDEELLNQYWIEIPRIPTSLALYFKYLSPTAYWTGRTSESGLIHLLLIDLLDGLCDED